MKQQVLRLIYYYYLMCFLLFWSYTQTIDLLFFVVIYHIIIIISFIRRIIYFIFIIIPQVSDVIEKLSLYSNKSYIDIKISRPSALSINTLLIFDIHDLNGSLFLKVSFFFLLAFSVPATLIIFLQKYMHHYNQISLILKLKI